MAKIIQFAPSITVFVGAAIVAIGTLWQAYMQSRSNAELREANGKIIKMQENSIRALKGAEYCLVEVHPEQDEGGRFVLQVFNRNELPVYDLSLAVSSNMPEQTLGEFRLQFAKHYVIGTVQPGMRLLGVPITPGPYHIDYYTRYGKYSEVGKFEIIDGAFKESFIVQSWDGKIMDKYTTPGYPSIY